MSCSSGIPFRRKEAVKQLTENFPVLVEFSQKDDDFQMKCTYKQGSKVEKGLDFFGKCFDEVCESHQFANLDTFLSSEIPRSILSSESKNEALASLYYSMVFDLPVYFCLSY